jgi:hypothetical protein
MRENLPIGTAWRISPNSHDIVCSVAERSKGIARDVLIRERRHDYAGVDDPSG